jgi:magnesium transporter
MNINEIKTAEFTWVDVVDPNKEDLESLAAKYSLPSALVQDCLEPEHLPKFEKVDNINFVILRAFDPNCDKEADNIQGLTHKLAVFFSDGFIFTFHRTLQPYVQTLFEKWKTKKDIKPNAAYTIASELFIKVAKTYETEIMTCYQRFDIFESEILGQSASAQLTQGYALKRRISIMNRLFLLMSGSISEAMEETSTKALKGLFQNAKEHLDKLLFQINEINDNLTFLLTLHVSLASQKTNEASHKANEVMRILTIFSVFFMPLNFIASIYGMNFEHMPELHWLHGYPFALSLMLSVAITVFIWFRKRHWL